MSGRTILETLIIPQSRNFQHFTELENSLPFYISPSLAPGLSQFSTFHTRILFLSDYFNIIFPSKLRSCRWSLSLSFSQKTEFVIRSFLVRATCFAHRIVFYLITTQVINLQRYCICLNIVKKFKKMYRLYSEVELRRH